ncbi:MAG: hypothetical protein V4640_13530 [Verrucomicrobiota bacterium]
MKTKLTYALLLAAAASGVALGQTTAYTTPVGYSTTTLKNGFNNVGLTLQAPTKVAGDLNVIGTTSVQDTSAGVNFTTSLGATGVLHVLEVTSGPALGLVTEITTWTADTITTVDNLSAAGVVAGNTYRIRKAPTLEEIFTTNTVSGPLTAGSATTADIVYVPTGVPGQYTQYFLSTAGAFRKVSPAGVSPNVPVVFLDGLFIQRKAAGTKDLVVSGEVKTDKTKGPLVTGFNYLGTVYPVGSTIQNSGLETSLLAGSATTADLIYVPSTVTPGQYTQVFRATAGTWRTVSPAAVAPVIDLTGAIFIQRKAAATTYTLNPPSTWTVTP